MDKLYVVTIPTRGYVVYEVMASSDDEAIRKISALKGKLKEEKQGDWDYSEDWSFEVFDK